MKTTIFSVCTVQLLALLFTLSSCRAQSSARADSVREEDERTLRQAGLSGTGPALLTFFHARARTDIEHESLHRLLHRFVEGEGEERVRATAELLGLGSLALQVLRRTVNDLDHPDAADRAARCLPWLEGQASNKLVIAAARLLPLTLPSPLEGRGLGEGDSAAAALLAYLPYADNPEVVAAVNAALIAVAAPSGKPDAALLRGLSDRLGVRRAAAAVALCRAVPPQQVPDVRKLLKDPSPNVRLSAALALAEANDAEAIPVLIDLLAELAAEKRPPVEEFLTKLAGEWAPVAKFGSDDKLARKIRRDAWMVWWRDADGEALLDVIEDHTLTPEMRRKIAGLIDKLGDDAFAVREAAGTELHHRGRIALAQLREAKSSKDPERARRARELVERIEREPMRHLPGVAVRLLALRKPEGATAALLAYLPLAEEEDRIEEVKKSLAALAVRDGKLDAALVRALKDTLPMMRATAAEALVKGGGKDGHQAVRDLLADDAAVVRLRVALALAAARDKAGVPVLIDLLTVLADEQVGRAEEALYQLAGESAPETPLGTAPAEKKKRRDAWLAWWKVNGDRVDMTRLSEQLSLGYTLICDGGRHRVFEIDRQGKERWAIDNIVGPFDAVVLPGKRVLLAEFNTGRVTERDFKGKILWVKQTPNPINVQRLPNGNTFIAGGNYIVEVDRTGKEIYTINNIPGNVWGAYRTRQGHIFCLTHLNQCHVLDTTGKILKTFNSNHNGSWWGCLDVLANGHILVPQPEAGKIVEFDKEGKVVREVKAPNPATATQLANGHILAADRQTNLVFEVDRAGKIVWEYKANNQILHVRRR